jgi:hypothetical protein
MKFASLFIVVLVLSGCNSAVDCDEFVGDHQEFSNSAKVTRVTLYTTPYKNKENYWKEEELRKISKSISVYGENAAELWQDLEKEELSYRLRPVATSSLRLPLVFENSLSQKFQLTIETTAVKNDKLYFFCDRPGNDDWWSEAKSACWQKHFGHLGGSEGR